jgi:plastocyanin
VTRGAALAAVLAVSTALLTAPAVTAAEPALVVSAGFSYVLPETKVPRGTDVELLNLDPAPHNVTSLATARNGSPLFRSDTVGAAGRTAVEGVERLAPGVYDYTCTVHPSMLGTFVVT